MKSLRLPVAAVLAATFLFSGCSPKGATDLAIKSAEGSYDTAKEKIRAVMPEEANAIEAKIADAKAKSAHGEYRAAVEEIRDVPERVKALSEQVEAKSKELKTTWDALAAGLPDAIKGLHDQVDHLQDAKAIPAGIDTASARAQLAAAEQGWDEAKDAEDKGNLADAITKATAAQKEVSDGLAALGKSASNAAAAAVH